jgi:hypothetical protein
VLSNISLLLKRKNRNNTKHKPNQRRDIDKKTQNSQQKHIPQLKVINLLSQPSHASSTSIPAFRDMFFTVSRNPLVEDLRWQG